MRDFHDDLERRLALAAEEHPDLAPAPPPRKRSRSRRRPALLGGLTATLAAVVAAVTMTGTSLADLPILDTPTRDASAIQDRAKAAADRGVDFSKAHVFGTPGGPAYVLLNEVERTICVVVPAPDEAGDYGVSCGQPIEKVEREGLQAQFVGDLGIDPAATSLVAFVLPEGARSVSVSPRLPGSTFRVESGVAVIETPGPTRLRWQVDGRAASLQLEGPFQPTTSILLTCPDGSSVEVAPPDESDRTRGQGNRDLRDLRREACR